MHETGNEDSQTNGHTTLFFFFWFVFFFWFFFVHVVVSLVLLELLVGIQGGE